MTSNLHQIVVTVNEQIKTDQVRRALSEERANRQRSAAIQKQMATERELRDAQQSRKGSLVDKELIKSLRRQVEALRHENVDVVLQKAEARDEADKVMAYARELELFAEKARKCVDERDTLISDWKHSNDAFKKLAIRIAKRSGISNEELQAELTKVVTDMLDEDPENVNRALTKKLVLIK